MILFLSDLYDLFLWIGEIWGWVSLFDCPKLRFDYNGPFGLILEWLHARAQNLAENVIWESKHANTNCEEKKVLIFSQIYN